MKLMKTKLAVGSKPAVEGEPSEAWLRLPTSNVKHDPWTDNGNKMYPGCKGFRKFAQARSSNAF